MGEGFYPPPLDTLLQAMPVSWKGKLEQYAGRLHRQQSDKTSVRIIDWLDLGHPLSMDDAAPRCAMLPFETTLHAAIEAIDEPGSARMDQRTKPSMQAGIEAAADLMGIEASAFVVMSACARAQTRLSQCDHQALLAALDEGTTSTPALLEAWQLHQDQVVRS